MGCGAPLFLVCVCCVLFCCSVVVGQFCLCLLCIVLLFCCCLPVLFAICLLFVTLAVFCVLSIVFVCYCSRYCYCYHRIIVCSFALPLSLFVFLRFLSLLSAACCVYVCCAVAFCLLCFVGLCRSCSCYLCSVVVFVWCHDCCAVLVLGLLRVVLVVVCFMTLPFSCPCCYRGWCLFPQFH